MKNILELLKKNLPIVICVVVAIGAVVAIFIPLGGFWDDLRTQAEGRKGAFSSLNELLTKQRTLPNLNPGASEAVPLEGFPTQQVIDRVRTVSDEFVKKAGNLLEAAAKLNEKAPLEPGALPNPQFVQANAFLLEYKKAVDMSINGRAQSLPVRIMTAGFAPTNDDMQREAAQIRERVTAATAIVQGNQVVNQQAVDAAVNAELAGLQDRIVRDVAEKCKVYIDQTTLDVQPQLLNSSTAPDPSVIFWAQMQLWVQEELFGAIASVNSAAKNVSESPIKHLLRVQAPIAFVGLTAAPGGDPNAPAAPPSADPGAPISLNFATTPTGRVSNGLFDVLHVDASFVVEAARLPEVLNSLSRGRLLGVIQVKQVEPIDPTVAANAGYFYGDAPVVRVDARFEVPMMRKWTTQYMPDRIKTSLGIPIEPAGGAPAAAPPPPGG